MKLGVALYETYEGHRLGGLEFCLHEGNLATRADVARRLRPYCDVLSAHLPSYLVADDVAREIEFNRDDGLVDYFVAHVTMRSKPGSPDWRGTWTQYVQHGQRVLFENHNQNTHPTDAGMVEAWEFLPIVQAGHSICLDVGHILYDASLKASGDLHRWIDLAEASFERFLPLPIEAVHVHTVALGGPDHVLAGFDIGPWLRRIRNRHPDVTFLVEIMDPTITNEMKLRALNDWLGSQTSNEPHKGHT